MDASENVCLKAIRDREQIEILCEKVNFKINEDLGESKVKNAIAVAGFNFHPQSLSRDLARLIPKTSGVFIQPFEHAKPKIFIEQDNSRILTTREVHVLGETDLVASLTILG